MALDGKMLLALTVSLLALTLAAEARCHSEVSALGRDRGPGQCGEYFGNCPDGSCCSSFGFCGFTEAYCGSGCQAEYGDCIDDEIHALGRDVGAGECGGNAGKCSNGLCCSQFGFCGNTEAYCGNGCQPQYGSCSGDNCLRASTGKASYYNTYVPSACYGNDENQLPRNRHMAAVSDGNPDLWKNGHGCGKHYRIRCEGKGCRNGDAITIKVVDRCPNGCEGRVFDLSLEAFGAIADINAGVIQVQYEPVDNANAIPWEQKKLITEVGHIRK